MRSKETASGQYNALSALSMARRDKQARSGSSPGSPQNGGKGAAVKDADYRIVLPWVQNAISGNEEHNKTLSAVLDNKGKADEALMNIIYNLLQSYPNGLSAEAVEDYKARIFKDMTGFGILDDYLADPEVEEINIFGPGPNQIEVVHSKKGGFMLPEGFKDATEVLDMVKRMIRKGGMHLDQSSPRVDSYMDGGTRVSAMCYPVVREDKGAVASIRKQTKATIRRNNLLDGATAMPEELEFIELCIRNKVSGALVGATGSGKTTLLNYFLNDYVTSTNGSGRVYIIEESRELQLPKGSKTIYTAISGDEGTKTQITSPDLLKSALRFHPTFISCAEMRGAEALNAMNSAQTGHIVWSTFHADNCEEAYPRLLSMCMMSGTTLSESLLLRNLVSAFPIIVSCQQLKDGSRRITGIFEADGVENDTVVGHYIYKAQITKYEYAEDGITVRHVYGRHARVGNLSDRLAQRIFDNCGRLDAVKKFAAPGWHPESLSAPEGDYPAAAEEF